MLGSHSRVYSPTCLHTLEQPLPSDYLVYDEHHEVARVPLDGRPNMPVAVFVDGACRGNGKANARATFGVYFGEGSPYNWHGRLPDTVRATSNTAEICAAQKALEIVAEYHTWNTECFHDGVVIITDSTYLFGAMTKWIYNWVRNRYLDAYGRPIINCDALGKLHNSIVCLEEKGIRVQFWRVDRAHNQDADRLANYAFYADRLANYAFLPLKDSFDLGSREFDIVWNPRLQAAHKGTTTKGNRDPDDLLWDRLQQNYALGPKNRRNVVPPFEIVGYIPMESSLDFRQGRYVEPFSQVLGYVVLDRSLGPRQRLHEVPPFDVRYTAVESY